MAHARRDPVALQLQALPWLWQALERPRRWVVAVDWTYGPLTTMRGKVLAVPIFCPALLGRHRALPLSQNHMESTLLAALPSGVEVILLLDRGFDRAGCFARLKEQGVPFLGCGCAVEPGWNLQGRGKPFGRQARPGCGGQPGYDGMGG